MLKDVHTITSNARTFARFQMTHDPCLPANLVKLYEKCAETVTIMDPLRDLGILTGARPRPGGRGRSSEVHSKIR